MELEKISYNGHDIQIYQDIYPEDPRSWDNLGTIITKKWWNECEWVNAHDTNAVLDRIRVVESKGGIVLPIYVYSHGIDQFRTRPWRDGELPQGHARFDSGLAGFIYAELDKIRKWYGWKRITAKRREQIANHLAEEIKAVNDYSTGNVYGFNIVDPETEEVIDTCWGYYGYEGKAQMIEECKHHIDSCL